MFDRAHLRLAATLGLGLGLAACTSNDDPVQQCFEQFAPDQGYDFESDDSGDCPQPLEGEPIECPTATPENIAQQCMDDGQTCDASTFITREAARCLAELEGLEAGISTWGLQLVYDYEHQRPLWQVNTVLSSDACDESGETMEIDAETGANLGVEPWHLTC